MTYALRWLYAIQLSSFWPGDRPRETFPAGVSAPVRGRIALSAQIGLLVMMLMMFSTSITVAPSGT